MIEAGNSIKKSQKIKKIKMKNLMMRFKQKKKLKWN
jgi:hypothetical protein